MKQFVSEVLPESVSPEAPEAQEGRLRSLFRRGGKVAVGTEVAQVGEVWQDDDEVALFGLEKTLVEYQGLWATHTVVIDDFLTDEENNGLLGQIVEESRGAPGDRDGRRKVARLQAKGFEQLAAVFVTAGRFFAIKDDLIDYDNVLSSVTEIKQDWVRIESKRAGLFSNLPETPSAETLHARLADLEKQANRTYKPIIKKEREMVRFIYKQIEDNPDQAVRLLDTFLDCVGSESNVDKNFTAFLANGYVMTGGESLLGVTMQIAEVAAGQGAFAKRYIDSQLAENDGSNMLAFFARQLADQGLTQPFGQYMAGQWVDWPPELAAGYQAYIDQLRSSYQISVKRESERNLKKTWLHPDKDNYEDEVDRLFSRIHGKANKQYAKPKATPPQTAKLKLSPSETLSVERGESQKVKLEPAVLVRVDGGAVVSSGSKVDDVLDGFLARNRQRDPVFIAELRKVVARLQKDPFGSGVRSLQVPDIDVDGKLTKIYRANPTWMAGISTSKQTKSARVVFAVSEGRLAIIAIPKNHGDYEQIIASL